MPENKPLTYHAASTGSGGVETTSVRAMVGFGLLSSVLALAVLRVLEPKTIIIASTGATP